MDEKVSIIVPIYNVEPYLERCIDSILKQTYQNIEIILIDDGSTDSCPAICDKYGKKYEQIQVIHKENAGLSSARNAGLDIMTGDLVMFVDSDDFIEADMLLELYNALIDCNADISICNLRSVNEAGKEVMLWPDDVIKDECIDNMRYWEKVFERHGTLYYVVAWNKLYRKKIWKTIRYPVGKINEDAFVLHDIVKQCNKVACTNYIGYNYVQRDSSIMAYKRKTADFDLFGAWLKRIDYFKSIGRSELIKRQMSQYLENLLFLYELCEKKDDKKNYIVYYNKYIDAYKYLRSMGETISVKEQIKRIGAAKNPMLMANVLRIYAFFWHKIHKGSIYK